MTLLVTGATGHIGLEVAKLAVSRGMAVVAPYRGELLPSTRAAAGPGVEWVATDLSDGEAVRRVVASRPIERCIHAAAISNEAYARPAPLDAIQSNVGATANLLEAARAHGWRRLVLVSTGSVFQKRADTVSPILEDQTPEPANIYSTTKTCAESLVAMYRSEFGVEASAVRISWVYGPPVVSLSPTRGPIPSLLARALKGIAIREGGADFRASFTYVADVVEGLLEAVEAPRLRHAIYHLGSGLNFSTGEVAVAIREAVPGAVIELGPGTEPWTTYTAIRGPLAGDRFKTDTGYAVRHSLKAGIGAYASWMRANPAAVAAASA